MGILYVCAIGLISRKPSTIVYRKSAKSRILLKRVRGIDVFPDGVKVTCQDGTVESGSIVIGADGVRSKVREIANNRASDERSVTEDGQNNPYTSTYRLFFGDVKKLPGLDPGTIYEGLPYGDIYSDSCWYQADVVQRVREAGFAHLGAHPILRK